MVARLLIWTAIARCCKTRHGAMLRVMEAFKFQTKLMSKTVNASTLRNGRVRSDVSLENAAPVLVFQVLKT